MTRSALEIVTLYNLEIWNKGQIELVPELCADPMIRYDANSVAVLGIEEQIARIRHNYEDLRPTFEPVVLAGDDEYVTLVWNVTGRDPNWKWCGIEVFRVVDGKIAEVWNGPYVDGRWVRGGALSVGIDGAAAADTPVMSADFDGGTARLVAPLETGTIALWLTGIFGAPAIDDREKRFAWTGTPPRLELCHSEPGRPPRRLSDAAISSLEIRWARSGLTNVSITLAGTANDSAALPSHAPSRPGVRLSECAGNFQPGTGTDARVVGASVLLDPSARRASGEVTLRFPAAIDPLSLCGTGSLSFGWHHQGRSLRFEAAAARLADPTGAFTDAGDVEATFQWDAGDIAAILSDETSWTANGED
ncbi:phage tail tube protein [Sphingopyxis macrogoltabida]|uniref:SnoaL-like domain-containing protein n=1 Tax=Sphingopyxis macrogoltabida TaxID=33050 RepID=A0AAC9FF37_SPHMC|nr:phage tail tube protein [Sphingopyxis macrogoltabida]ALJ12103.1 hypothetical protein LH19_04415 [Sphingopyxis macrogoltabida]AMU88278.1 hypothetical protein ATM17_04375 [Sphingopyxis macrogoltabida]